MELLAHRQRKLMVYYEVREVIKKWFAIGILTEEVEEKKSFKTCFYWSVLCQKSFLLELPKMSGRVLPITLWFLFLSKTEM